MKVDFEKNKNNCILFEKICIDRKEIDDLYINKNDLTLEESLNNLILDALVYKPTTYFNPNLIAILNLQDSALKHILKRRYIASNHYMQNELFTAEEQLREIIAEFPNRKFYLWLKRNILIDIKNLEIQRMHYEGKFKIGFTEVHVAAAPLLN